MPNNPETERIGLNPTATGREIKEPPLRQVDDNPVQWRVRQDKPRRYCDSATDSGHPRVHAGVRRHQGGISDVESAGDVGKHIPLLDRIRPLFTDYLLAARNRVFRGYCWHPREDGDDEGSGCERASPTNADSAPSGTRQIPNHRFMLSPRVGLFPAPANPKNDSNPTLG